MDKYYYHVCTEGLAKSLWFYDEEDYVAGMNVIPACAINQDVTVLCFCLMSNHVHFIIRGTEVGCNGFIWQYKRLRNRQIKARYGVARSIEMSGVLVKRIASLDYMETAMAYVMRNPTAAGLATMPSEYKWSSAHLYFSGKSFHNPGFTRLGDYSVRRKRRLFKTWTSLPDEYLVEDGRMIFPGSYVDYKTVEKFYRSPKRLLYCLSSTKDMEEEMETGVLAKVRYSDEELIASMEIICFEKYHLPSVGKLKIEDRYFLARELKKRYGAGPKQLSRIMGLDYESLKKLL